MCGRFTLTWEEWRQVAGALGVENEGEAAASYRPRFNIAPTDEHFIITSEFERPKARRARWGLVNRWAKEQQPRQPMHQRQGRNARSADNIQRILPAAPLHLTSRWLLRTGRPQS